MESKYHSQQLSLKHQSAKFFWITIFLILPALAMFYLATSQLYAAIAVIAFLQIVGLFIWQRERFIRYWDGFIVLFVVIFYCGVLYAFIDTLKSLTVTEAFFLGYGFAYVHHSLQSRIAKLFNIIKADILLLAARGLLISQLSFGDLLNFSFFGQIALNVVHLVTVYVQQIEAKQLFLNSYAYKQELKRMRETLLNFVPNGLLVLSRNLQETLYSNQAFAKLINSAVDPCSPSNLEGKIDSDMAAKLQKLVVEKTFSSKRNIQDFFKKTFGEGASLLKVLKEFDKYSILKKEPLALRVICTHSLGHQELFEAKIVMMPWDNKEAIVVVFEDITDKEAAISLRMTDANKDKIISTVSHEFRTPLNGILGILQIMQKQITDKEILRYTALCKSNASLLLSVANTMLDIQQIREGKFKLFPTKVNVINMFEEIKSLFEFQCAAKNIYLKVQINQGVPKYTYTDVNRLKQVLINLINNAIKFTFEGGITINVEVSPDCAHAIKFSIIDTGLGIAEEDRAKLFRMFGKLEKTENINQSGSGLGLMISDTLARLLNLTNQAKGVSVESQSGKGSTFSFFISKALGRPSIDMGGPETESDEVSGESLKSVEDKINNYTMSMRRSSFVPSIKYSYVQHDLGSLILNKSSDTVASPKKLLSVSNSRVFSQLEIEQGISQMKTTKGSHNVLDPGRTSIDSNLLNRSIESLKKLSPPGSQILRYSEGDQVGCRSPKRFSFRAQENLKPVVTRKRSSLFKPRSESPPSGTILWALIVDDNPFNIMVAQHLTEANGFKVKTALNGKSAIEMVKKHVAIGQPFRVILMDYEMPVMNGIETTKILKKMMKEKEIPNIPVVALTAHDKQEERKNCLECGMMDVLVKPISEEKLAKVLDKVK